MNTQTDEWRLELLAGHADDELSPAERSVVEKQLADQPDLNGELAVQRNWSRANTSRWKRLAVPAPSANSWQQVRRGIDSAMARPASPPPPRRTAIGGVLARAVGASAAIALLVYLSVTLWPATIPVPGQLQGLTGDVFAVVSTDEVEIVSVQGDDFGIIVVGQPPLLGPLEMATYGEIVLDSIATGPDGQPSKVTVVPTDPKKPIFVNPNDKTHPVP